MKQNESLINSAIKSLENKISFARKNGFLLKRIGEELKYYEPDELLSLIKQSEIKVDIGEERKWIVVNTNTQNLTHNKVRQEVLNHIETVIKEVEKQGSEPQIIESLKNLQSKQEEKMSIQFIRVERVAKKEVNYYCNKNPDIPAIFVSSKYGTIRFNTSAVELLKLEPESLVEFNILKENTAEEKRHYSVNKTLLPD